MYGCTDVDLIQELQRASHRGVHVEVFYDPSGSQASLHQNTSFATPLLCQGLMHKKLLILDEETVFLGSANFTPTSLRMHDNLVVGLYERNLAHFLLYSLENSFSFPLMKQKGTFFHLPDFQHQALDQILSAIEQAQTSIHLAL
ncbi:MAG: hypothetical protein FJZ58_08155, partial [Chlamydiae bacterium]|nr:hypothetical protein [Chlamydiota bacterium]